jgi:hypothetical protein
VSTLIETYAAHHAVYSAHDAVYITPVHHTPSTFQYHTMLSLYCFCRYTCMVGKKGSLKQVLAALRQVGGGGEESRKSKNGRRRGGESGGSGGCNGGCTRTNLSTITSTSTRHHQQQHTPSPAFTYPAFLYRLSHASTNKSCQQILPTNPANKSCQQTLLTNPANKPC